MAKLVEVFPAILDTALIAKADVSKSGKSLVVNSPAFVGEYTDPTTGQVYTARMSGNVFLTPKAASKSKGSALPFTGELPKLAPRKADK